MTEINLDEVEVANNDASSRFEAHVNGHLAFVTYRRLDATLILDHTEVPRALESHGLAGKLVQTALEYARSAGLKVVPLCPFAASYIRRHVEYQTLLSPATLKRLLQQ